MEEGIEAHLNLGRLEGGDGASEGGSDASHFDELDGGREGGVCVQEWRSGGSRTSLYGKTLACAV